MSEPYVTLWTYPWDLLDDGVDTALDTIVELGLRTISLATVYHSFEQIRPHLAGPKYFVAPEAAVYFQPTASLYAETCIKPHLSPIVSRGRDPLRLVGEGCRRRGISLTSWTVCLHNTYQGRQHPACCPTNVYGDVFTSNLDPTNPEVRSFVVAVCRDLAATGLIDRLELEAIGFGGRPHFHGHEKTGVDLGPAGWFLFTLPASASARALGEQAGVDVDRLFAKIRQTLDPVFRDGRPLPGDPASLAAENPGLDSYARALRRSITDLVREIREAAGLPLSMIAMGDVWTSLCDYREIASVAEAIETLAYTPSPDVLEQRVRSVAETAEITADRIVVGLQAYGAAAPDDRTLLSCVERALDLGARRFSFYNYGIMPAAHLPWLRTAAEVIRRRVDGPT
ncbi:MAG TPA: hypothetical protein VNL16_12800 [Chloroflexota bacterium]|nr:hypothetical protein [Chloroflexota bacterium]